MMSKINRFLEENNEDSGIWKMLKMAINKVEEFEE